jgi:hypothetical protein
MMLKWLSPYIYMVCYRSLQYGQGYLQLDYIFVDRMFAVPVLEILVDQREGLVQTVTGLGLVGKMAEVMVPVPVLVLVLVEVDRVFEYFSMTMLKTNTGIELEAGSHGSEE